MTTTTITNTSNVYQVLSSKRHKQVMLHMNGATFGPQVSFSTFISFFLV